MKSPKIWFYIMLSKKLLFFLFFFCGFTVMAQDCADVQKLYDKGKQAEKAQDYDVAFEILTKAAQEAHKRKCFYLLWKTKGTIAGIYTELSGYAQGLNYFQQALTISREHPELNKYGVISLHNIGYVYSVQENPEEALHYYKESYALAKKYEFKYHVGLSVVGLYEDKGELEKAKAVLEELDGKLEIEEKKQIWRATYAELLYLDGKTEQAKKIAEKLYSEIKKGKNEICRICVLMLLSKVYSGLGEYDLAIRFTEEGLLTIKSTEDINKVHLKIELYEDIASFYSKKEDFHRAVLYKDSILVAKDSLSRIVNQHLFQINRVKFEVQEYQNEIKQNQQKQRMERILFIVLIGVGLLIFFFVFKMLKSHAVKQKQKRIIAENQQKIVELELEQEKNEHLLLERKMIVLKNESKLKQEQLKSKISKKNRMLSARALYHSGRNELLEKIITSLSKISSVSKNKAINDYIRELKGHLKTDSKWEDFVAHFEKVNPGFLKKLKVVHPQLTKRDIRFLCYLYMNLSTKEICAIFNITPPALWKRKQRLIEKMGLEKEGLYDYILNLTHSKD